MTESVLVVEDEPAIRELIGFACETAGYRVFRAGSVTEARKVLEAERPDIILLDWMLPDQSGLSWLEQLKREEKNAGIPVIMLTARGTESDKVAGLDAGADDYLTKPFSVDELLARLRVTQRRLLLIKTDTAQESPIFINGALKIDYAAGCAYLDRAELHLTPIEYKLLCLLSKNVGKVLRT